MGTQLLFQETEEFERDMQHLDAALREAVASRINHVALACAKDVSGFASLARSLASDDLALQPVMMELGQGYESSLHTFEAAPDVHLVLAIDDDPIFGQVIFTLFRAVPGASLEQACRDVVQALYKSMPRFVLPQEVAVG